MLTEVVVQQGSKQLERNMLGILFIIKNIREF